MCKISVDGTDFHIYEPTPFNRKWYSHKFKGPGVRYEIRRCIQTGDIVWVNGPFPCGAYPDRKIATQEGLEDGLDDCERYVCDGGIYGPRAEKPNGLNNADQYKKKWFEHDMRQSIGASNSSAYWSKCFGTGS